MKVRKKLELNIIIPPRENGPLTQDELRQLIDLFTVLYEMKIEQDERELFKRFGIEEDSIE